MEQIFTWCLNHWQLLLQLVISIVTFVILLFQKKVKVEDAMAGLLISLPDYIKDAEKSGATGTQKFVIVFQKCLTYLSFATGDSLDVVSACYATQINEAIENILSTPQKKEVSK